MQGERIHFLKFLLNLVYLLYLLEQATAQSNSYINLNDKTIKEELELGSFVANVASELKALNKQMKVEQFTLLDDMNSYFALDSQTGILTTKREIDREQLCANRQVCVRSCESLEGKCELNVKVLLMPSYQILNLNVYVQDVNDNRPQFRSRNLTQKINENVPIGYKVPIDLAYDSDFGKNTVKYYNLSASPSGRNKFRLAQNLSESQLYLVVSDELDRELESEYNLVLSAYDGGGLRADLNLLVEIVDINDNNPRFERESYRFTIAENAQVDMLIGEVKANDPDHGPNGQLRYSLVDSSNGIGGSLNSRFIMPKGGNVVQSKQNVFRYFDLDEKSGQLRLKMPVDFEDEKQYTLTVQARDMGVGSLPAYAQIEINVVDVNDNQPEISVSFLNTLFRNQSSETPQVSDIYISESTKVNKFIAHVSIVDKDSNENGQVDWQIHVNDELFASSNGQTQVDSVFKLIKLSSNSFTLNLAQQLDRELMQTYRMSITAWDHGVPELDKSVYNFSIKVLDENDNAPKFDRLTYEASVYENNEPFDVILKVNAHDLDADGPNSRIKYSIKEAVMSDYVYIDQNGFIRSRTRFDREKIDKFVFHVVATDQGKPTELSSSAMVTLNILDLNDNEPRIEFNSSLYHRVINRQSVYLRVGEKMPVNSRLVDFSAHDLDHQENGQVEFVFAAHSNLDHVFKLTANGELKLNKNLNKYKQSLYELDIVCKDLGKTISLNSTIKFTIEIVDVNEYCIRNLNEKPNRVAFLNRDAFKSDELLFQADYSLAKSELSSEQLTHKDLVRTQLTRNNNKSSSEFDVFTLAISLKSNVTSNASQLNRLMLGKYTIRLKLQDNLNPSCVRHESFKLFIGNNLINEKEINNYLLSLKRKKVSNGMGQEDESINQMADVNEDSFKNRNDAELKFDSFNESGDDATSLLRANLNKLAKSDYVLLFILIVIIVITSILFAFIAVVCIYNRYKKQYKSSSRKPMGNKRARKSEKANKSKIDFDVDKRLNEDEDMMMNEHLSTASSTASSSLNEKKKLNKANNRKIYFNDLNVSTSSTSSTSHTTDLSSNHNGKHHNAHSTQYTLITNSTTSNGTLIYRDMQDEIEEEENMMMMMVTSPVGTFRKAQQQPIYSTVNAKATLSNKQPKFTNLGLSLSRNAGYESSNRSNSGSGVESIGMDTTTTGEDSSKQSSQHTSPNSSSHQIDSASSSSSSSNAIVKHKKSNESNHVNRSNAHTIICYDDQTQQQQQQQQHFMSFKKGPMFNSSTLTAPTTPSTYAKTMNYNSQNCANAGLGRTSFDL